MEDEKIKSKKMTEYEKALKEVLNENIDIEFQGKDVEKLESSAQFDKVNEMLLKYYNERNESDFQKQLKEELNIDVYKKLEEKFDKVDNEMNKDEQEEQIRNMSKEAFEGEQVDKEVEQRAIKKAEQEVESKSGEEVDLKAEIIKAVYEEAFDKYSTLLEKYKMNQLRDESMTIGDKEGTELVLYERYLTNLEKNYAGYAKLRGLEVKSLSDDPDIKAKKEKLEYDMKKMTRSNDMEIEENIQRIKILSDRRNAIAEKMAELTDNRKYMSPEQFKQSMDYYQEQYFEVTVELRSQDPSMEEYKSQITTENENRDFSNREIGIRSDNIIAGSYQEMDNYGNIKEDIGDGNLEEIQDINEDYINVSQESIEELIKDAKYALEYGNYEQAVEIVESAEMMMYGRITSQRDTDEDVIHENDAEVKEGMEQNQENEPTNSFMQEMESEVATDKEAELQERIRNIEENLNKDKNDMEIEQGNIEQVHIRTRFNKKN